MVGKIIRINISKDRGVIKDSVERIELIENWGEGDVQSGDWDKD